MSKSTLKTSFLFQDLSEEHLDKIAGVAKESSFNAGSTLFRTGQAADSLYIIEMGTVKVMKVDSASGDSEEIARLGSGSHFGEMALVLQGHLRTNNRSHRNHACPELSATTLKAMLFRFGARKAFYEVVPVAWRDV